jgi:hypothetical protein
MREPDALVADANEVRHGQGLQRRLFALVRLNYRHAGRKRVGLENAESH